MYDTFRPLAASFHQNIFHSSRKGNKIDRKGARCVSRVVEKATRVTCIHISRSHVVGLLCAMSSVKPARGCPLGANQDARYV